MAHGEKHKSEGEARHAHRGRKIALVATGLSLLTASEARALPGSQPPQYGGRSAVHAPQKPGKPSLRPGGSVAEAEGFTVERDGVSATVSRLGQVSNEIARYSMTYKTKDGPPKSFDFLADSNAGEIRDILIGEERTVVVTENTVFVVIGRAALEREDQWVTINGTMQEGFECNFYRLPEDLQGNQENADGTTTPRLVSATATKDGSGEYLWLMGMDGHLRITTVDRNIGTYAHMHFPASQDYVLLDAGGIALLAKTGSSTVYALSAAFGIQPPQIRSVPITLPAVARGKPGIRGSERDRVLAFDNVEFVVIVGEPGNPDSVTLLTTTSQ